MRRPNAFSVLFTVGVLITAIPSGYLAIHTLTAGDHPPIPGPPPGIDGPPDFKPPGPPPLPGTSYSSSATPSDSAAGANETFTVDAQQTGIQWAPAESARITPGVQTYTGDGQCTANFVFTDDAENVYIGQAAHCASTGEPTDSNGCTSASQPLGSTVTFNREGSPLSRGEVLGSGELVYSSWISMQQDGETDANACAYNDFALVKISPRDTTNVNPTVPHWGGPVGINTGGTANGDTVHSYGNSSLRFGIPTFSPQTGTASDTDSSIGGWSHALTSPTPGVPGDSGSAFIDSAGNALGTLSTLGVAIPIINNIGDLSHELAYAQTYSGISGLKLVLGTAPFNSNQ